MAETYTVRVCCKNCGYGRFPAFMGMKIPKGTQANDYLRDCECPDCGCLEIVSLS